MKFKWSFLGVVLVASILSCQSKRLQPSDISRASASELDFATEIYLPALGLSRKDLSVSGLSSGGFMAQQLAVIHSKTFRGVGIVAGGPFYCSQGDAFAGIKMCMKTPEKIEVAKLLEFARKFADQGLIDPLEYLREQKVVLIHGENDGVVPPANGQKIIEFYKSMGSQNIHTKFDFSMGHAFPTPMGPVKCEETEKPNLNNCDNFDGAGFILQNLFEGVSPSSREPAVPANLHRFSQIEFQAHSSGMENFGFVYIPTRCKTGGSECRLHVALHGCLQYPRNNLGFQGIGQVFPEKTGYMEWAEKNNIVILYPAVVPSLGQSKTEPYTNPYGCWDWYAYSGDDFATRSGKQIKTIMKMVDHLTNTNTN